VGTLLHAAKRQPLESTPGERLWIEIESVLLNNKEPSSGSPNPGYGRHARRRCSPNFAAARNTPQGMKMHRLSSASSVFCSSISIVLLLTAACSRTDQPTGHADRAETPGTTAPASKPPASNSSAAIPRLKGPGHAAAPTRIEERLAHEQWHGDLDGIAKRRFLRILVAPSKLGFFFDELHMQGAIYEYSREFEKFLNKKLDTGDRAIHAVFVPVARERLIPMLVDGKGDLVASLTGTSESRQQLVEFSEPLYNDAKIIVVTGPSAPPVAALEDLSGKEIYCRKNTLPYEALVRLSETFQKQGKPPIQLMPSDEDLQPEDILEMVNAGLIPIAVNENKLLEYWTKVLPNLQPHPEMVLVEGPLCWAMQANTPQLKAVVDEFVQTHKVGTAYGNIISHKYLGDIKWAKNATSSHDILRFEQLVKLFQTYGDKYDFPYLLLAAQGYQESGLNPNLKSPAGAVGVMQIKPSTAAAKPIEIPDVQKTDRNVEAGAKYLRYMWTQYYADEPMDSLTKGVFALAAYNAGPNRIQKLRTQAAAEGYDPNRWFNNVEILASREIGSETVQYVSNIYKYYLAYKMVMDRNAKEETSRQKMLSRARK
jgi:membrane-bound lytic murein transglycosylase MltF